MTELAKTNLRPDIVAPGEPTHPVADRVLSVGIVGAGEIVSRIHLPVLSACAGIRIAYIVDKNPETSRSVAASYKLASVTTDDLDKLPPTDVALLAVPVAARLPYYELFARRGTHVLAEKPLAAASEDAERICALYPDYSLACGFQRRSFASVALAKLLVDENWFGPLRSISVSEGALTTKTGADSRFYDDASAGGGVLMDLGCHSLDMAMYISNAAEAVPVEQRFVYDGAVDREVEAHLTLSTPQGACPLNYLVSWLRPAKNAIELAFENCTVSLSCQPAKSIQIHGRQDSRPAPVLTMEQAGASTVYQAFYLEWMAFLDGVRSGQPSRFSAINCLPTIRAVEALYRAGKRNP
jgi:predicted dehydrogenase